MSHAFETPVMVGPILIEPSADHERDLISRAQAKDVGAFEHLYRTYLPRVFALCLRMTADSRRAEELTQQAFISVWEKLPRFRGESAFASWLHRLTVNTVLSDLRAEQRRTRRIFGTEDPAALETPPLAPVHGTRIDLEQAIAGLPPQARIVFVLHDIEGWLHDEIAKELGIAVGTAKAQLHHARKRLQEVLR
jgi:RNA polymerase sigma-70 factor (ECF subfamily)